MSKQYLKGLVSGIIITFLLTSVVFASTTTIDILFNGVNIEVNSQKVKADNILYKGTTYVPLRAIAEMLGMEVGWIQHTNTATLTSKIETHAENSKKTEEPMSIDTKRIKLISSTSPVSVGSEVSLTIEGTPKARYSLLISDPSIKKLEDQVAGEDGKVTWTWKLSANTKSGNYVITILDIDSGEMLTTMLTVK